MRFPLWFPKFFFILTPNTRVTSSLGRVLCLDRELTNVVQWSIKLGLTSFTSISFIFTGSSFYIFYYHFFVPFNPFPYFSAVSYFIPLSLPIPFPSPFSQSLQYTFPTYTFFLLPALASFHCIFMIHHIFISQFSFFFFCLLSFSFSFREFSVFLPSFTTFIFQI